MASEHAQQQSELAKHEYQPASSSDTAQPASISQEVHAAAEQQQQQAACGHLKQQLAELLDSQQHTEQTLAAASDLLGQARARLSAEEDSQQQVVAGLDDVLMGLAELQLQLDSTNSCAACLAKAVRCMERLSTKKTVEAQSAFKLGCAALRSDVAALSAVHQSLAELLGSEHAAAATGDSPEVAEAELLLHALLRQQSGNQKEACARISTSFTSLLAELQASVFPATSSSSGSPAHGSSARKRSASPVSARPGSPRAPSRLGRDSTPSSPMQSPRQQRTGSEAAAAPCVADISTAVDALPAQQRVASSSQDAHQPSGEAVVALAAEEHGGSSSPSLSGMAAEAPSCEMRRWSNPVFSASGADRQQAASGVALTTTTAGGGSPNSNVFSNSDCQFNPTFMETEVSDDSQMQQCMTSSSQPECHLMKQQAAADDGAATPAAAAATSDAITSGAAASTASCTSSTNHRCVPQMPPSGPLCVFMEALDAEEELSPRSSTQHNPVLPSRLDACQLHNPSDFAIPMPAQTDTAAAAAAAAAADPSVTPGSCSPAPPAVVLEEGALYSKEVLKAALQLPLAPTGSAAMLQQQPEPVACWSVSAQTESMQGVAAWSADSFDALTRQTPSKSTTLKHMQDLGVPATKSVASKHADGLSTLARQGTSFDASLQQLLQCLHQAAVVLGPSALAAHAACEGSLGEAELAVLHSAACAGLADAQRVQGVMQELVAKLQAAQQQQQQPGKGEAAASAVSECADPSAATLAAAAAAGPVRHSSGSEWTIAAVHTGNRASCSSDGSSCHALDATLSLRHGSTDGFGHAAWSSEGGVAPGMIAAPAVTGAVPAAAAVDGDEVASISATGGRGSEDAANPQRQPEPCARLPSLDLLGTGGSTEQLLLSDEHSASLAFAPGSSPDVLGQGVGVTGDAPATVANTAEEWMVVAATAAHAAAAAGEATTSAAHSEACFSASTSTPGGSPAPLAYTDAAGFLLEDGRPEDSPREPLGSCMPPFLSKAMKGLKKQLAHPHNHQHHHPAGRPTMDFAAAGGAADGLGFSTAAAAAGANDDFSRADSSLQQQAMLVWSLRDQPAVAERKLQQFQEQQQQQEAGSALQLSPRRARPATVDELSMMLAHHHLLSSSTSGSKGHAGSKAGWRRKTCDSMVPTHNSKSSEPRASAAAGASSGGIASVQQALKAFLEATSRPGSPAWQVVDHVHQDGTISIEAAAEACDGAGAATEQTAAADAAYNSSSIQPTLPAAATLPEDQQQQQEHVQHHRQQEQQQQPADAAAAETVAAAHTHSTSEVILLQQQLDQAQQETQQLQELVSIHQGLLLRLQDAAAVSESAARNAPAQLVEAQAECERLQQQLAASELQLGTLRVLQGQQQHALQQQLEESQEEVQRLTELVAVHSTLILRLQQVHQETEATSTSPQCQPPAASTAPVNVAAADGSADAASAAVTAVLPAAADHTHNSYSEQVIEQLSGEITRLLAEQAAAEGLHSQLDAARVRNDALQTQVDDLSAALEELRLELALTQKEQQQQQQPNSTEEKDTSDAAKACELSQLVLQQQVLQQTIEEAAAAHAQVAALQAELHASQECNQELRVQLAAMAATLAKVETATCKPEVHEWPQPQPQQAAHHQEQRQQEQQPEVDEVVHAAVIQQLSNAMNKQAELEALLQQREEQLRELSVQLCSNGHSVGTQKHAAATATPLPSLAGGGGGTTLADEVAALLASSPDKAASSTAACCVHSSGGEPMTAAGTPEQQQQHTTSAAAVSNNDVKDAAATANSAAGGNTARRSTVGHETSLQSWGSMEGRTTPLLLTRPGSIVARGHGATGTTAAAAGDNSSSQTATATSSSSASVLAPPQASAASTPQADAQAADNQITQGGAAAGADMADSSLAAGNSLWGTVDGTRPEDAFAILRDRQLEQVTSQLAHTETQLTAATAQLEQLLLSSAQQNDRIQDLSQELCMARAEAAHKMLSVHQQLQSATATQPGASTALDECSLPEEATSAAAAAAGASGCSEAIELPPSNEASSLSKLLTLLSGPQGLNIGSEEALMLRKQQQEGGANSVLEAAEPVGGTTEPQAAAAAAVEGCAAGHGAYEAASTAQPRQIPAAVAAGLLTAVRTAAARAMAAESQQQLLSEEIQLQLDLQELQQKELGVLKQRLAAAEDQAARATSCLQAKQQQLQQLQAKLKRQQQQHKLQAKLQELQQQQQQQEQAVPSPVVVRKGGYAAAAAAAATATATPAGTSARDRKAAAAGVSRVHVSWQLGAGHGADGVDSGDDEDGEQEASPRSTAAQHYKHSNKTAPVAAAPQQSASTTSPAPVATSHFCVDAATPESAGKRVGRGGMSEPGVRPNLARVGGVAQKAQGSSINKAAAKPPSRGTVRSSNDALGVAAGSAAACSLQLEAHHSTDKHYASPAAADASGSSCVRSRRTQQLSSSTEQLRLSVGQLDSSQADNTAYTHAEELRRLGRELVAKERCIAALQATNQMHKQQLQQLARSAADAGLQVTPQHLLNIADDAPAGSPPTAASNSAAASGRTGSPRAARTAKATHLAASPSAPSVAPQGAAGTSAPRDLAPSAAAPAIGPAAAARTSQQAAAAVKPVSIRYC